ncbi:GNAT family N-acetyltransferase [Alkalicoccus saliphilus]|uniref:N-acetyltransferase n=1 Tax=Alkalicoccus saliphilus TaxID=200989 RepID=A0A2T4U3N7_9BACI|nr:GNAT family N-acetyltransferase [Alkalicoccus saliphilus]PTL38014.1 N-acetyltransferase [Alkalicoccus saliphilus]
MTKLTMHPVTAENWREITALTPKENQERFIENNAVSILESIYETEHEWRCFGLYQGKDAAGFIMIGAEDKEEGWIWLDRFMLDEKFQEKGLGSSFLKTAVEYIRRNYKVREIILSVTEENKAAKTFYEKHGFQNPGRIDPENGEEIFSLRLSG